MTLTFNNRQFCNYAKGAHQLLCLTSAITWRPKTGEAFLLSVVAKLHMALLILRSNCKFPVLVPTKSESLSKSNKDTY